MSASCEIVVQDGAGVDPALAEELRCWLARLVGALAPQALSLGVRLAPDAEVRHFNATLRGRDHDTDVLSFAGDEGHLGDLLIALPVARVQAAAAGHDLERELKELLLHGLLHCLGHDHETDAGEMEALELELRQRWVDGC